MRLSLSLTSKESFGSDLPTCLESNREFFVCAMTIPTEGNDRAKGPQVVGKVGESIWLERGENDPRRLLFAIRR